MKLAALVPAAIVLISMCGSPVPPPPASVSGTVIFDANRNGVHDRCDSPLSNVQVSALADDGTKALARSDEGGSFTIIEVPSGTATISLDSTSSLFWPISNASSSAAGVAVEVSGPHDTSGVELLAGTRAAVPSGVIVGVIFNDANANGVIDIDECGIPNAYAYSPTSFSPPSSFEVPPADGTFVIDASQSAAPVFASLNDPGWSATVGDPCLEGIKPTRLQNTNLFEANIGFTRGQTGFYISGVAFDDENENGRRDDGELPIPNLDLAAGSNGPSCSYFGPASTVSDANGEFRIGPLPQGTYKVYVNSMGAPLSQIIYQSRPERSFTVRDADITADIALVVLPGAFADILVFMDHNANGVRDSGEDALSANVCLEGEGVPGLQPHFIDKQMYVNPCGSSEPGFPSYSTSDAIRIGPVLPGTYRPSIYPYDFPVYGPVYGPEVTLSESDNLYVEIPFVVEPTPTPRPDDTIASLIFRDGGEPQEMNVCYAEPGWLGEEAVVNPISAQGNTWAFAAGLSSARLPGCANSPTATPLNAPPADLTAPRTFNLAGFEPLYAATNYNISGAVTQITVRRATGLWGISLPNYYPGSIFIFVDEEFEPIARCPFAQPCEY